MAISIRRATSADAQELQELAAQTFELATPPDTSRSDIDAFIKLNLSRKSFDAHLADPSRILLLAEDGERQAGYAMLISGEIADPELAATVDAAASRLAGGGRVIELSKFYVALTNHGSGLAATLMAATLEAAAATGAALCWLGVNHRNERAARFYAKHGFELIGTKRFLVGDTWFDDHVRARAL